jgi:hypothetical protein
MQEFLQHLMDNGPRFIGFVLAIIALIQLFVIFFVNRKNITTDLRGKDLTWQFAELSGIAWLVLFPVLVVCDLFGVQAAPVVWASMDTIYLINVMGRSANKFIETKFGGKSNPSENEPPKI